MIGMLAIDIALAALAVGLIGLCGFAIALLFGATSFETRRRPQSQLALPPVPTRRVITGTPVELPSTVPVSISADPAARGDHHVAEPAKPVGGAKPAAETDADRLAALEDAERTIRRMMDEDPEAVVRLISSWLAQDRADNSRGVAW